VSSATVFTDGSGTTGGPGGVGYVAVVDGQETEGSLPLARATNQQAEILAAAYALHTIPPCAEVVVYSDSEYVVLGMQSRIVEWIARGWRTKAGSPVANRRHWERLLEAVGRHEKVWFEWVRGHAGHPENERADALAVAARHRARQEEAA
jgi:ribonuclease HI